MIEKLKLIGHRLVKIGQRFLDQEERDHAFSRRQWRNHGLHGMAAVMLFVLLRFWILGSAGIVSGSAVTALVISLGFGAKEWFEWMGKEADGARRWFLDSFLDWFTATALVTLMAIMAAGGF